MKFSKKQEKNLFCPFAGFSILLVWLVCAQTHFSKAQSNSEFELSPRVGSSLDSNEIEYFNIFPDFDNIRSAVYRKDNLGNVRFLLSKANGSDTTVTLSKMGGEELGKLINQFEKVADEPSLVNWNLLQGFHQAKLNYFESTGRNVTVYALSGTFSGRLLMATDSAVCIWQKKGDFQPDDCQRYVKRIPYSEIRALEMRPAFSSKVFGASIGAGLAIAAVQLGLRITTHGDYLNSANSLAILAVGGLAGAVGGFFFDGIASIGRYKSINQNFSNYSRVLKKIRKHGMFNSVFPPELSSFR